MNLSQNDTGRAFEYGIAMAFNASSKVEPSLKFDINIIGHPSSASKHLINYLG